MFSNAESGKFAVRGPDQISGTEFRVQNCNNAQLYVHDFISNTSVEDCNDT